MSVHREMHVFLCVYADMRGMTMARKKDTGPTEEELAADSVVRFKGHILLYKYVSALRFSYKDFGEVLKYIRAELFDMPKYLPGGPVVIVPTMAVKFFQEKGFKFRKERVVTRGDKRLSE